MMELSYRLVDLHENEFQKEDLSIEFGAMETWRHYRCAARVAD